MGKKKRKPSGANSKAGSPSGSCNKKSTGKSQPKEQPCNLIAIEIEKSSAVERTRWGESCTKFVVLPDLTKSSASGGNSEFSMFHPGSELDGGIPSIYMVAVRSNLEDGKNKAVTIKAKLRDHKSCPKKEKKHQVLVIKNDEEPGLIRTVNAKVKSYLDGYKKLEKELQEEIEKAKKLGKTIYKAAKQTADDDAFGGALTIAEYALQKDDDADENDDKDDGKDKKSSPAEVEAKVYPQHPTTAALLSVVPKSLASWCPEDFQNCLHTATLYETLQALWTKNFNPRSYTISAPESCGIPHGKEPPITELEAKILVYPADQFKFSLRVPSGLKSEAGYEGKWVGKDGELKKVPKDEDPKEDPKDDVQEDASTTAAAKEAAPAENAISALNAQLKQQATSFVNDITSEEDDDDDDDDDGPVFEYSDETFILPWKEVRKEEKKKEKEEYLLGKKKKDDDDDWEDPQEKFSIKLTRSPSEKSDEDDDELPSVREAVHTIVTIAQTIREVWEGWSGISYTLGFSANASVSFLEGDLDWEWGWRETPRLNEKPTKYFDGTPVTDEDKKLSLIVYSHQYKAKLKLFAFDVALNFGLEFKAYYLQFGVVLSGEVKGELKLEADGTREFCPFAQQYYGLEHDEWSEAKITGELKLEGVLWNPDCVNLVGKTETGYWVKGRLASVNDEQTQERIGPAVKYNWKFTGVELNLDIKVKGFVNFKRKWNVKDESRTHEAFFPDYTSRDIQKARQLITSCQIEIDETREKIQSLSETLQEQYLKSFFVGRWYAMKQQPWLLYPDYDAFTVQKWIDDLFLIAKKKSEEGYVSYFKSFVTSALSDIEGDNVRQLIEALQSFRDASQKIIECLREALATTTDAIMAFRDEENQAAAEGSAYVSPSAVAVHKFNLARDAIEELRYQWDGGGEADAEGCGFESSLNESTRLVSVFQDRTKRIAELKEGYGRNRRSLD